MRKLLSLIFLLSLLVMTGMAVQPVYAEDGSDPENFVDFDFNWKYNEGLRYTWTIEKSADQTDLLLSDGQLFGVNYTVKVSNTAVVASYVVRGYITVKNIDPVNQVEILGFYVEGLLGSPAVNCPTMTLAVGESVVCDFYATPADKTPGYVYVWTGVDDGTTTDIKMRRKWVDYDLNENNHFDPTIPVETVDECIVVSDTNVGELGTVCAGDAPKTFTYTLDFGAHPDADVKLECGENTHTNIASFVTNDTGATGQDDAVVNAEVTCEVGGGCSLTQGYWKTHSKYGPAPYDSTWGTLEDTTFYLSSKTWYQVFWTPPAGNPYYNLAHQYMAAYLNQVNGASVPANVSDAMAAADAFFAANSPDTKWTKAQKQMITGWAGLLDSYNNGLIGPGHCSE